MARAALAAAGFFLLLLGCGALGGPDGGVPAPRAVAEDACGDDQACGTAFVHQEGRRMDAGSGSEATNDGFSLVQTPVVGGHASLLIQFLEVGPPLGVVFAVAIWGSFLLLLWAQPRWTVEFKAQACDRVLGFSHALVSTVLGLMAELTTSPACRIGDSWIRGAVQMSIGFFIVDLISMLVVDVMYRWRPVDGPMLFHHIFILLCFGCGVAFDLGLWFLATLLINEGSTPFLHVFWYLSYTGQKDSTKFLVNGLFLNFTFFFCRMVFIPFSYRQFASVSYCSGRTGFEGAMFWLINPFYACIFALNVLWFVKLIRGSIKKLLSTCRKAPNHSETQALLEN